MTTVVMRRLPLLLGGLVALVALSGASFGGSTQARWVIADLGTFGGPGSTAVAVNERGQVVGLADTKLRAGRDREWVNHGFLWQGGRMVDLGARSGLPNSAAVALNERGEVVLIAQAVNEDVDGYHLSRAYLWQRGHITDLRNRGRSSVALAINERGETIGCIGSFARIDVSFPRVECFHTEGVLWRQSALTDLGSLETEPKAISDRGVVVGSSATKLKDKYGYPIMHAFLWHNGKMRDLGTLGGRESGASAIDASGRVVGSAETKVINRADDYEDRGSPVRRGFVWTGGKMRELRTFGGPDGAAVAVNRRGQVVGWADTRRTSGADRHMGETCGDFKYSHPAPHAFLWANGRMLDLGTLGGSESEATALNDKGLVVGWADTKDKDADQCAVGHAFVWERGRMTDLGTLPGGRASEAVAVNNRGQIIGWSETRDGRKHAVIWTRR
jgi:probable HAF family extracellular repeat protein